MLVILFGVAIALGAAARSTWSPCGLSMLSQITPVAEAGRRQKFGVTATWFIAGAILGGVTLGSAMAGAAIVCAAAAIGHTTALVLLGGCALSAAAVDAQLLGFGPPFLRRQVNQEWLSEYRPWVYGGGFGWQIGVGITTYVMTAAVPLVIVAGALTEKPSAALAIGTLFGLARGLAVLTGARVRTTAALLEFHRRFEAWAEPVREAVIALELVVTATAAWITAPVPLAAGVTVASVALLARATSPVRGRITAGGTERAPSRT